MEAGDTAVVTVTSPTYGEVEYTFTAGDFPYLVVPAQTATIDNGDVVISNVTLKSTGVNETITLGMCRARKTGGGLVTLGTPTYDSIEGKIIVPLTETATAGEYTVIVLTSSDGIVKFLGSVTFTVTE